MDVAFGVVHVDALIGGLCGARDHVMILDPVGICDAVYAVQLWLVYWMYIEVSPHCYSKSSRQPPSKVQQTPPAKSNPRNNIQKHYEDITTSFIYLDPSHICY